MPLIWAVLKCKCSASSLGAQPASDSLLPQAYPYLPSSHLPSHTAPPYCCVTHPSTTPLPNTAIPTVHCRAHSTIHPYSAASPHSPYVCQCPREQTRATTICTSCAEWDSWFLVNRKKMRKVSTERHESKQNALRGIEVNINYRWAPLCITKVWVSLPKQGVAMSTRSRRITRIIGEHKLQGRTLKIRTPRMVIQHHTRYMVHRRWSRHFLIQVTGRRSAR